ncbi:MAG: cation transporter [Paludibacter sp.]|nr:cation transporter [Paludibacter sp.]
MNNEKKLYKQAWLLSLFTIFYNIAEGVISVIFGLEDEALTLFGFGLDSFIEVVSGIGIAVMVIRIQREPESSKSRFEIAALKVTGSAFYVLALGLTVGIIMSLAEHRTPETTVWGVVVSVASILVMFWLLNAKRRVGRQLQSEPIIADSNCTKVCIYMSIVLLASSLIYELTGFEYADVLGSAGLIWFSISEGKEAFEKARSKNDCSCSCGCH